MSECVDRCPSCGRPTQAQLRMLYAGRNRLSQKWAAYIQAVRLRLGMSQKDFADLLDLSHSYICRFERTGWVPSFDCCKQIAADLMLDRGELLAAAGYV